MSVPRFFIDRPIFAGVISIVIPLVGALALFTLPIAQYPEIAPPTIQVSTSYPGANAKTVAETVATPIEQQINGVENMLYMSSSSTSDGVMTLNVTFKLGTDIDQAQVLVQNRVATAAPTLPQEVQRIGVTTKKQSPDITMVVHLFSPDGSLDSVFTSNYALLQLRDELARLPGVGDVTVFGAREYSMRIWLDPEKVASRGLTAQDVVEAIREQNVQVAAGTVGAQPVPAGATAFQYTVNTQGWLTDEAAFGEIVIKTGDDGRITRVRDVARVELAAKDYTVNSQLGGKPATAIGIFQLPGTNALETSDRVREKMRELRTRFPAGIFGMVLAIGIVVDDAIVVVEAIEHHIAGGMSPRDAARRAMDEVSGAVVAVAIVLGAVFVPTAFMGGITGQFFRQFALTIAVSTAIAALHSLALSPALGALLLQPRGAAKDRLQRFLDAVRGWFFRAFNRAFGWNSRAYGGGVARLTRVAAIVLVAYAGLLALTVLGFQATPTGFIAHRLPGARRAV